MATDSNSLDQQQPQPAPSGNPHPTEIAQLMGVRLAVASEVDQGSFWDEAKLKELTGAARAARWGR